VHGWAYYGDGESIVCRWTSTRFVTPAIVLALRTEAITVPYSVCAS
jgi:hypothetical protein